MTNRRDFIRKGTMAMAGITLASTTTGWTILSKDNFVTKRPDVAKRNFTSEAVEKTIVATKAKIKDTKLAWMFENCFPNTLDTTVEFGTKNGKPDTFVITGDIHAMWLRDSTAQVWPYLQLASQDKKLQSLLAGVVNR